LVGSVMLQLVSSFRWRVRPWLPAKNEHLKLHPLAPKYWRAYIAGFGEPFQKFFIGYLLFMLVQQFVWQIGPTQEAIFGYWCNYGNTAFTPYVPEWENMGDIFATSPLPPFGMTIVLTAVSLTIIIIEDSNLQASEKATALQKDMKEALTTRPKFNSHVEFLTVSQYKNRFTAMALAAKVGAFGTLCGLSLEGLIDAIKDYLKSCKIGYLGGEEGSADFDACLQRSETKVANQNLLIEFIVASIILLVFLSVYYVLVHANLVSEEEEEEEKEEEEGGNSDDDGIELSSMPEPSTEEEGLAQGNLMEAIKQLKEAKRKVKECERLYTKVCETSQSEAAAITFNEAKDEESPAAPVPSMGTDESPSPVEIPREPTVFV